MKDEYDFSRASPAREVEHLSALREERTSKTRITIMLDDDIIKQFRTRARAHGLRYQTEINRALREYLADDRVTLDSIRDVLRQELHKDI